MLLSTTAPGWGHLGAEEQAQGPTNSVLWKVALNLHAIKIIYVFLMYWFATPWKPVRGSYACLEPARSAKQVADHPGRTKNSESFRFEFIGKRDLACCKPKTTYFTCFVWHHIYLYFKLFQVCWLWYASSISENGRSIFRWGRLSEQFHPFCHTAEWRFQS